MRKEIKKETIYISELSDITYYISDDGFRRSKYKSEIKNYETYLKNQEKLHLQLKSIKILKTYKGNFNANEWNYVFIKNEEELLFLRNKIYDARGKDHLKIGEWQKVRYISDCGDYTDEIDILDGTEMVEELKIQQNCFNIILNKGE